MNNSPDIELINTQIGRSALVAGIGLLIMALTVPFAEFNIFPNLIDFKNAQLTFDNIQTNRGLFTLGIFLHLTTLVFDVVVAWALYIFLRPVNTDLSLLTAWFRIVFAVLSLASLLNMIDVLNLTGSSNYLADIDQRPQLVLHAIKNHSTQWSFSLIFFGVYLVLLGYLVYRASYIPKVFGILLIIAGIGYFTDSMKRFLFPHVDMGFLMITFFGELVFMLWLLFKGWRVKFTG